MEVSIGSEPWAVIVATHRKVEVQQSICSVSKIKRCLPGNVSKIKRCLPGNGTEVTEELPIISEVHFQHNDVFISRNVKN